MIEIANKLNIKPTKINDVDIFIDKMNKNKLKTEQQHLNKLLRLYPEIIKDIINDKLNNYTNNE